MRLLNHHHYVCGSTSQRASSRRIATAALFSVLSSRRNATTESPPLRLWISVPACIHPEGLHSCPVQRAYIPEGCDSRLLSSVHASQRRATTGAHDGCCVRRRPRLRASSVRCLEGGLKPLRFGTGRRGHHPYGAVGWPVANCRSAAPTPYVCIPPPIHTRRKLVCLPPVAPSTCRRPTPSGRTSGYGPVARALPA